MVKIVLLKRRFLLSGYDVLYKLIVRPLLFSVSSAVSHALLIRFLRWCDHSLLLVFLFSLLRLMTMRSINFVAGNVKLAHPLIVAAGLVKGDGFASEDEAWRALQNGDNIIAGWRSVPALLGAVEFGSFTRYPRLGNSGTVLWRDVSTQSTQNRVGLKNPGALAAAEFLAQRRHQLPKVFGINLAVSPQTLLEQEALDLKASLEAFLRRHVVPSWFTLNLSCPNTEDDPQCHQTAETAERLCAVMLDTLRSYNLDVPLWVKISPNLSTQQLEALMRVFTELGVSAVVATNTLPCPAPDLPDVTAGIGGGRLFPAAYKTVQHLVHIATKYEDPPDIIACGGIIDGRSYRAYQMLGVRAAQYWSALVYRGLLAAALIESEAS